MKTILVTGGAGFIGSHLCEFLLNKNNKIICVDNFFTGSRTNLQHLFKNQNFKLIEHDIINPLFVDEKLDQIYNLACPASPIHYQFNAIRTIKANTLGVINILGMAKKHNAKILQASTSEVYGNPLEHPQKETYFGNVNCFGERSCYDEGKRIAESLMYAYNKHNQVEIRIARRFNTYGPRMLQNDGRVISNFVVQALKNEDITIYGDGSQTRSFCYVSDMVEALYKLMESSLNFPVNLGNPDEFTIIELAEKIRKMTRSKSKVVHKRLPEDDPARRKPDISRAKKELKWNPKIGMDEGLKQTIEYFSNFIFDEFNGSISHN